MSGSSLHNISDPSKRPAFNGEKLRKLRLGNDYTLRALADKITSEHHYKISFQRLAQLEDGEGDPGAYLLVVFAKIFGVDEAFFYKESSSPTKGALGE